MNLSFAITMILLGLAAFIGAILQSRAKDKVLHHFDGFHVTVEKKNGRIIWGTMKLHPSGMELIYKYDVLDEQGHIETSYMLYKGEYRELQGIYRYVDEMTEENKIRREKDLHESFHPGPLRLLRRRSRNFLNAAADAFQAMIDMIIRTARPGGERIAFTGQRQLRRVGKNIVGYVGNAFDPMMEEYIGEKVVVEVEEDGVVYEMVGILKDYTSDFLEVLNVQHPESQEIHLTADEMEKIEGDIELTIRDEDLHIRNTSSQPLLLHGLETPNRVQEINAVMDYDDEVIVKLEPGEALKDIQLGFKIIREMDMICPRGHALVRHGAERYDATYMFDFGQVLGDWVRGDDEESRYRREVAEHPGDGTCMVNLALLLLRRGDLQEAIEWLRKALEVPETLVDRGKLAQRELRKAEKRLAETKQETFMLKRRKETGPRVIEATPQATVEPKAETPAPVLTAFDRQ